MCDPPVNAAGQIAFGKLSSLTGATFFSGNFSCQVANKNHPGDRCLPSRHFGVTTFNMLRQHGVDIVRVVVADGEDRLAAAARAAGIEVAVQADPRLVVPSEIADGTDLIVTAHSHARISQEALAATKLGGIGYHPSLLPRHRGIA